MSRNKKSKSVKHATKIVLRLFDGIKHPKEADVVKTIRGVAKDYGVDPGELYEEVRGFIITYEMGR